MGGRALALMVISKKRRIAGVKAASYRAFLLSMAS